MNKMSADTTSKLMYKPIGVTHIVINAVTMFFLTAITWIEFHYTANISSVEIGYIVAQNIVVAAGVAYFTTKLQGLGINDQTAKA